GTRNPGKMHNWSGSVSGPGVDQFQCLEWISSSAWSGSVPALGIDFGNLKCL
ncbi:hypothetical protein P7K49_029972, partial [Saguinus oedipus]